MQFRPAIRAARILDNRFITVGLLLIVATCVSAIAWSQEKTQEAKPEQLLTQQTFAKSWVFYSPEKTAKLADTWRLVSSTDPAEKENPVLVCLGKPIGYLRSADVYGDYELGLEWKYASDPNGNSGILIHTGDQDQIWPTSIQIQLHAPKAGSIFPTMGAKTDNTVNAKDLSRPIEQWNTCVITSVDGKVSVVINGKKVGEVTGCEPNKGHIALQSEGSEVHFRKVWLRKMEVKPEKEAGTPAN